MSRTDETVGIATTQGADETFFQRFSRRKHEARQGGADALSPEDDPAGTATAVQTVGHDGRSDDRDLLTDADMPDLGSLDEQSDYTGFLSAKVSESLRRAALRKLFHSTAFNVVDELDDYNEDFTRFESLGDIVTAEMRHRAEIERRRELEPEAVEEDHAGAAEPDEPDDAKAQPSTAASSAEPDLVDAPGESEAREQHLEDQQDDRPSAPV